MALELDRVHIYAQVPGRSYSQLSKTNAYVRLSHDNSPPMFCQGAALYSDGGQKVRDADIPSWFRAEAEKITSKVKIESGLDVLLDRLAKAPAAPVAALEPAPAPDEKPGGDEFDDAADARARAEATSGTRRPNAKVQHKRKARRTTARKRA